MWGFTLVIFSFSLGNLAYLDLARTNCVHSPNYGRNIAKKRQSEIQIRVGERMTIVVDLHLCKLFLFFLVPDHIQKFYRIATDTNRIRNSSK